MTAAQRNLFGDDDRDAAEFSRAAEPAGLVLRARPGRPLTKVQRTFNRLVGKIERLRTKLVKDAARYDEAVVFHHEHVRPLAERATALRKDVVRFLAQFRTDKRFKARADRRILETILQEQLSDIASVEGTLVDEDLRAIFEAAYGVGFEQAEADSADAARAAMEEIFGQHGIRVDLSGFRPGMTAEETAAQAAEMMDELRRKAEEDAADDPRSKNARSVGAARRPKAKTKRHLEAEARERQIDELRKKSIGTIYRQLAKVLHPDLEQDPNRRERKGALMQDVTAAYRNNDLHTLLRLELEWIRGEEADVARLTDETFALYNDLLGEQVAELEQALVDLRMHPKYSVLIVMTPFSEVLDTDGRARVQHLQSLIDGFEESLARLRSKDGWREIREVIRLYRRRSRF